MNFPSASGPHPGADTTRAGIRTRFWKRGKLHACSRADVYELRTGEGKMEDALEEISGAERLLARKTARSAANRRRRRRWRWRNGSSNEKKGWSVDANSHINPVPPPCDASSSSSRVLSAGETYARICTLRATCLGSDLAHKSPGQRFLRIPWKTARIISRLFAFCRDPPPFRLRILMFNTLRTLAEVGVGWRWRGRRGEILPMLPEPDNREILSLTNENSRVLYGQLVYPPLPPFFFTRNKIATGWRVVERQIVLKRFFSHLFVRFDTSIRYGRKDRVKISESIEL